MTDWKTRPSRVQQMAGVSGVQREHLVAELVEVLRSRSGDLDAFNTAVEALRLIGTSVVSSVLALLQPELPAETRIAATLALGQLGSELAVEPLLNLLGDGDPNVRYHAIEALGRLRARQAVPPLAALLSSDDLFLIFPSLVSLKEIGQATALPDLLACLADEMLVQEALEAIGACGSAAVLPALARGLEQGRLPRGATLEACEAVLASCEADSLRGVSSPIAAMASALGEKTIRELMELPPDDLSPAARRCACRMLARLAAQEGVTPEAALQRVLRLGAGLDLFALDFPLARVPERTLQEMLRGAGEECKLALIAILSGSQSAGLLLGLLRDPEPNLRRAAAEALARFPVPLELDDWLPFAAAADTEVTAAVRVALEKVAPAGLSRDRLGELLDHPDPASRSFAAQAARHLSPQSAPQDTFLLDRLAAEVDPAVRVALLESALLRGEPATGWLEEHWSDLSRAETGIVAANLASLPDPQAVGWLTRCLQARDLWTRLQAGRFCANWPARARALEPALQEALLSDPLPPIRAAGLRLLPTEGENSDAILTQAVTDPEPEVRRAAMIGLGLSPAPSAQATLQRLLEKIEPTEQEALLETLEPGPSSWALARQRLREPDPPKAAFALLWGGGQRECEALVEGALSHRRAESLSPPDGVTAAQVGDVLEALMSTAWRDDEIWQTTWVDAAFRLGYKDLGRLERDWSAWGQRARLLALYDLGANEDLVLLAESLTNHPEPGLRDLARLILDNGARSL